MILDSYSLSTAQRCPRRYLIERDFPRGRWAPRDLLESTLRGAILDLSSGLPKEEVTRKAVIRLRGVARDPGLDILTNPWDLTQDLAGVISNVIEALSREVLLSFRLGPLVELGGLDQWRVTSFLDEGGSLHRWAFPSRLDQDSLSRELHGWAVFGDMAAVGGPLTLHMVETGSFRAGRWHSPWNEAYKHPAIQNHFRFQKLGGGKLAGSWTRIKFEAGKGSSPTWVDAMERDSLRLVHHLPVKELPEEARESFRRQMTREATRLDNLGRGEKALSLLPLYRPACDFPSVCPHQWRCYPASAPSTD